MLNDLKNFAIILWVLCQGLSWFSPEIYGTFNALSEKAYYEQAEKLGLWKE